MLNAITEIFFPKELSIKKIENGIYKIYFDCKTSKEIYQYNINIDYKDYHKHKDGYSIIFTHKDVAFVWSYLGSSEEKIRPHLFAIKNYLDNKMSIHHIIEKKYLYSVFYDFAYFANEKLYFNRGYAYHKPEGIVRYSFECKYISYDDIIKCIDNNLNSYIDFEIGLKEDNHMEIEKPLVGIVDKLLEMYNSNFIAKLICTGFYNEKLYYFFSVNKSYICVDEEGIICNDINKIIPNFESDSINIQINQLLRKTKS